jgi:hypothetical protein
MGVEWSYLDMMFGTMVLGDVVAEVLCSGVPVNANVLIADLIDDPKVAHFHRAGSLTFYGVVGDSDGSGVVAMYGRGRLGMAHFFENEADDFDFLSVEKKGAKLGLGGRCGDVFEYGAQTVDGTVENDWLVVAR